MFLAALMMAAGLAQTTPDAGSQPRGVADQDFPRVIPAPKERPMLSGPMQNTPRIQPGPAGRAQPASQLQEGTPPTRPSEPGSPGSAAAAAAILPVETEVDVRLARSLTSAEASLDDPVEFAVTEDVRLGGKVIVSRGAKAWGIVTRVERRARLMRDGMIQIDMQGLCLADGSVVGLRGKDPKQENGAQLAGGPATNSSLLALPAVPIMVFLYGHDVTIPQGREFRMFTTEDARIDVERSRLDPPPACPLPHTATRAAAERAAAVDSSMAELSVRSSPNNAEVYVDGRFVGSAPAVLRLPAGEHLITFRLQGWQRYERHLLLTPGGRATLNAVLDELRPLTAVPSEPGDEPQE
jgi:hypothetical protein